jgi:hypothetical protein
MAALTRVLILQASLALSLTLLLGSSAKAAIEPSSGQQAALARIEKIVVQGNVVNNPGEQYVKVVRAPRGDVEAGQVGSVLYAEDQLKTGDATVVLTYLGNKSRQSQVIIGRNGNAVIQRESVFLKVGRIWIKAAGAFTVRTIYWVLGVPGTDFYFKVEDSVTLESRERAKLEVTSGAVDVSLASASAANTSVKRPPMRGQAIGAVQTKSQTLRVGSGQGVNLVEGERIPAISYPLSAERLDELNNWIRQIEAARPDKVGSGNPVPEPEVVRLVLGNYTYLAVLNVYLSPNGEKSWGPDRLGGDILGSNKFFTLQMDSNAGDSLWDLKVVANRGFTLEWDALKLGERIIFSFLDGEICAGTTPPDRVRRFISLRNTTPFPIHKVYLTLAGAKVWREEVLREEVLQSGQAKQITVGLFEVAEDWDLKIVLSNGASLVWRKMELGEFFDIELAYSEGKIVAIPR